MSSDFAPSQAEVALTNKIFEKCDPQKLGIITGDAAVAIFNGTKLSAGVLGKVWGISDKDNNGVLTRKGVSIALRLMGHAQRGEEVTEALISKPGMPPNIEGFSLPILQHHTGSSTGRAKSPPPPVSSVPLLTPQDRARFMKIFYGCNPVGGMLSGDKASEVFIKSKLHVDKLSQIWNLADTEGRGSLDATEFCIAMYLIQATLSEQLSFVPTTLPPGLYDQASGKFEALVHTTTGNSSQLSPSTSRFPLGALQQQHTGPVQTQITGRGPPPSIPPRPTVVPGANAFSHSSPFGAPPVPQWDITPAEKVNSDRFFDGLDKPKKGFIEADAAVPFMMQSGLPEDVLAQIWDLSDMNRDGRLTKDGFAVAFHLIQSKLAGNAVPATLPLSLVPPSLRGTLQSSSPPQQPAQDTVHDLLWDDSPPSSAVVPSQSTQQPLQPQRTGPLNAAPIQPHTTGPYQPPIQPQRTGPQLSQSAPLFPQVSGGPAQFIAHPPAPDPFASSASRDFLSDDEPSAPAPLLEDKSAEIGNLHNQLNSTNRSLDTVKNERADIEQRLAEQAAELSNLQTQLTAARTAYETETNLLVTLRERYANQNADISKARHELITAESDVSALRLEKNDVQNVLLRDKEEVRELQKKMAAAGAEIETIKAEIEKAKKDAKQQKGLSAIARKQLAAREAEKAKVESERGEAEAELIEAIKEKDEAEAESSGEAGAITSNEGPPPEHDITKPASPDILAAAIAQPLPDTPGGSIFSPPSPRSSSMKGTNPFERFTTASPPPQTPFMSFSSSTEPPPSTQLNGDNSAELNLDDPFGIGGSGHSRVEEPQPMSGSTETSITRDRAASPYSPGEDLFVTPPVTASTFHEFPKGAEHTFTPLDAAMSKFPSIPGAFSDGPDSAASAKEAGIDQDTSDDEDGPEEAFAAPKQPVQEAPPPAPKVASKKSSTGSSFDVIFGDNSETSASMVSVPSTVTPNQTGNDTSKSPFQPALSTGTNPLSPFSASDKPAEKPNGTIAGRNAFDEAMGVIPSSQPPSNVSLGFESAFDDDFDFAAAKADTNAPLFPVPVHTPSQSPTTTNGGFNPFPPAPTSAGTSSNLNGQFNNPFGAGNFSLAPAPPIIQVSGQDKDEGSPFSLDAPFLFNTTSGTTTTTITTTTKPETTETGTTGGTPDLNMDRVPSFGGDKTTKTAAILNAFGPGPVPQMPSNPTPPVQFPRPSTSPPLQQRVPSPAPGSNGSTHSHNELSSSKLTPPKPRPTPVDKLKEKEHPTRSSRLSIRLPFGKKKKSLETKAPPIPSRTPQLSPPQENYTETEDVDAVKQLTAMGFSREESVSALERSSYDFQRALNSLVGSV